MEQKLKTIRGKFHKALSLRLPDWKQNFAIKTDASKVAFGSVLGQLDKGETSVP